MSKLTNVSLMRRRPKPTPPIIPKVTVKVQTGHLPHQTLLTTPIIIIIMGSARTTRENTLDNLNRPNNPNSNLYQLLLLEEKWNLTYWTIAQLVVG